MTSPRPDLGPLFAPTSIAVVGATPREDSYAHRTLTNLQALGYRGRVVGVHPRHREVAGVPCVPSLSDLDAAVDAVVVAVPAAAVAAVVAEAGAIGCGGAVVYAAGFGEVAGGVALEAELRAAAARHRLPVCGPNGNGIVSLRHRVALWGDPVAARPSGGVAVVTQSGNIGVGALALRGGLGLHSVVSCGNQAVLDAADYLEHLAGDDDVRAIALYLESSGDGDRLCRALARCAERDLPVVVLKAGASAIAASAAQAHTGAVAGDHRVFSALAAEAGATVVDDAAELLELAKALAVAPRAPRPGVAVLTCSGGDSAIAADVAERIGVELPALAATTRRRLEAVLPEAATAANPLDYTSLLWADSKALREMIVALGADPAVGSVLALYDRTPEEDPLALAEHDRIRAGLIAGADEAEVPVLCAATLPAFLHDETADELATAGVASLAGLTTGLRAAAALHRPEVSADRLREIAATATTGAPGPWLSEHEAKVLLADAGVPVAEGAVADDADHAVALAARLGHPVALKLSHPSIQHKSDVGALALGLGDAAAVRQAYAILRSRSPHPDAVVLVERMAPPGVELLVAAHRDGVVPCLVVGVGGIWTELLDDAAIVPLPAGPERIAAAIRSLRAAPLLTGGRGGTAADLDAAAALAAAAGAALLRKDLALVELNPVLVHEHGATAVDAVVRRQS